MRLLPIAVLATACSHPDDVEGVWSGACTFDGDEVGVGIDISEAKYGIVDGDITYTWLGDEWQGTIDGIHSDDVLELSIEVEFEGDWTWTGDFEGDLDGSDLTGLMTLSADQFELEGDCLLEN